MLISFENVTEKVNKGYCEDLDFQKAFDQISHRRLLHKLKAHGIRVSSHRLKIGCLIENRDGINGSFSDWKEVTNRITQGLVLGCNCSLFTVMTWRKKRYKKFSNLPMILK